MPVLTIVRSHDSEPSRPPIRPERVRLSVSRISSSTVITVVGDVDAANSHDVAAGVMAHLIDCDQLALDLGSLDFLAVQAYSWLHDVNLACIQRGIPWVLVPSAAVSRVLGLADPNRTLPVAPSPSVGPETVKESRRHLRLLYR